MATGAFDYPAALLSKPPPGAVVVAADGCPPTGFRERASPQAPPARVRSGRPLPSQRLGQAIIAQTATV